MPKELDWPLLEKHLFIEDVLLRTLNKQVRNFTGSGNTPMMFPLQPVIEDIEKAAEEDHDKRTVKMCQGILKAVDSRPDDKYVAYRKVYTSLFYCMSMYYIFASLLDVFLSLTCSILFRC